MQKLLTYLKQGNGRGLRVMFIFSVLATLLSWGVSYESIMKMSQVQGVPSKIIPWIHFGFILGTFVFTWVLYGLVVGISTLLALAFKLQPTKGFIFRASLVSIVGLFGLSILLTLVSHILAFLGQVALQLFPIVVAILIPVLLVMLIAFALAEPKEGKKKK